jgi:hypothetical protein
VPDTDGRSPAAVADAAGNTHAATTLRTPGAASRAFTPGQLVLVARGKGMRRCPARVVERRGRTYSVAFLSAGEEAEVARRGGTKARGGHGRGDGWGGTENNVQVGGGERGRERGGGERDMGGERGGGGERERERRPLH